MSSYDVLLSHSGAAVPALESLARRLRDAGVEPFFDKWHLVPGEPRQEALENALDQSRTCAVFLDGPIGPWQNEEIRSGLESRAQDPSFRVIPVLLPGSREPGQGQLPRFIRRLTWVDFRAGLDDEEAFHRLLAGIRGEPPGPGLRAQLPQRLYRCMAPPQAPFVRRNEYDLVVSILCSGEAVTALRGAGGFGKTAISQELCHDPRIRDRFPDGILWVILGERTDEEARLARILDLIRWWTEKDPPTFQTLHAAGAHWRHLMAGRRVLLVLDDVWHPEDIPPFQGLGTDSALLIATRDRQTLPAGIIPIEIDAMEISSAVRLLGTGLPESADAELGNLAVRLGEWPLLLTMVNRQLRELIQEDYLPFERALREVEEALDAEGLTAFDREDLESRNRAVAHTLGASLRRLSPDDAERFQQLVVFPQDREVPLSVVQKLWHLDAVRARRLCSRLHDLSLLLRFDRHAGTILLHDVIRAYLLKKHESEIPALHQRLLTSCCPSTGRWADLPPDETYLWRHLAHHLIGARESDRLRELLCDLRFLEARLEATGIEALLADISPLTKSYQEVRLLQETLRLAAHILARDPRQLAGQLLARLVGEIPGIQKLLLRARSWSRRSWLRPRTASLPGPGGPLIYTLEGHSNGVLAVAMLNHRQIISASQDKTLRVWDLESGSSPRTLHGHLFGINAVTALSGSRVVSASSDKTLRLWDVYQGKTLLILEGHNSGVNGVTHLDSWRVVSASSDETLRVWSLETGQTLQTLRGHTRGVDAVVHLDARHVVSGSVDGTLRIWDVLQGESLRTLEGHSKGILGLALLDRGRVVSASYDGTLRIWDLATGQTRQVLEADPPSVSAAVAVLDPSHLISGSFDGVLLVWDLETGKTVTRLKAHSNGVLSLAVLADRRVVTASIDKTLRCWDLQGRLPPTLDGHSNKVMALSMLSDRRMISSSTDGTLRLWDLETSQSIGSPLQGHTAEVDAVAAVGNTRVVSASLDKNLHLWDLDRREILATLRGHTGAVKAVAALDERHVVSASADGTLRIWNLETAQTVGLLEGHSRSVNRVAVLDAGRIVSASHDGTLRVWDLERGQTLRVIATESGDLLDLAVLDRNRVIAASQDGTLLICDVEAGRVLERVEGAGKVQALAVLSPRRVILASADGTLGLRDLETGETCCLFSLEESATALAISPDGRLLVAGDSLGKVHFFDMLDPATLEGDH